MLLSQSNPVKVGFTILGRPQFDLLGAQQKFDEAFNLIKDFEWDLIRIKEPITNVEEALSVARRLNTQNISLLIILQGTFTDASLLQTLAESCNVPLILWGYPNPPADGGRPAFNSLCGVNLGVNALYLAKRSVKVIYGEINKQQNIKELGKYARAISTINYLRGKKIGLVGKRPFGFTACDFNEIELFKTFGMQINYITLSRVFNKAEKEITKETLQQLLTEAQQLKDAESIPSFQLKQSVRAYWALKEIVQEEGLACIAVECWPEFLTDFGGAACYALSRLNDEGIIAACEADINGAVTLLTLHYLSKGIPALLDMVTTDETNNEALFWHCGATPTCLCSKTTVPIASVHPNRKIGLAVNFPLKGGEVTIARFSPSADGAYRLFYTGGQGLERPLAYQGCSLPVQFNALDRYLATVFNHGLEHHYALVYGNFTEELKVIGELKNLELISVPGYSY